MIGNNIIYLVSGYYRICGYWLDNYSMSFANFFAIVYSYRNAKNKKNWWRGVWDFIKEMGSPGGE